MGISINKIDERKEAIKTFFEEEGKEIDIKDIHFKENPYGQSSFFTPYGEYYVFTDEEADKFVAEDIENLIDECNGSLACFGEFEDMVKERFLTWDGGEEWFRNDYNEYLDGLENDDANDSRFPNKLAEVLYYSQMGIKTPDDLEDYGSDDFINQWLEDDYQDIEELRQNYIDKEIEEMDGDYIGEYTLRFGDSSIQEKLQTGEITIDYEGIAEWSCNLSGRGQRISSVDGQENEVEVNDTTYYIYLCRTKEDLEWSNQMIKDQLDDIDNMER